MTTNLLQTTTAAPAPAPAEAEAATVAAHLGRDAPRASGFPIKDVTKGCCVEKKML